jgi:hypothetical protein
MRKIRKLSFEELIMENKKILLLDKEALERIDEKIVNKRQKSI